MLEKYDVWTKEFMESWKELDWKRTLDVIAKDCKYYENPVDEPCANFDEIVKLWEVVKENQKDITYSYEIVAYNEDVAIVNWQMKRAFIPTNSVQNIDGIFEIAVNDEGKCTLFKQWRFTK